MNRSYGGESLARRRSRSWLALAALAATAVTAQPLPSLAPMIERVSPAVVNIAVSGRLATVNPLSDDPLLRRFFDLPPNLDLPPERQREFQSAGSGVIVDAKDGYILTNHHVIENAAKITITLLDSRSMEASVVGSDAASDLAVLQVTADDLMEMSFGESDNLRVGDFVVAIGNPFGFSHTVTSGIVSGLGRNRVNPNREAYEDFIQTDASINPGNSGGALVNLEGNLVGINSAIISRGGGNIGIGFAIPVSIALNVMEQLIAFGEVSRGVLGVLIQSITPDVATNYGLPDTMGALITEVNPGSAAEDAGLRVEDIIVTVNERRVRDSGSLRNMIGLMRPGDEVRIGFIRDGQRRSATATLSPLTAPVARAAPETTIDPDPVFEGTELTPAETGRGVLVERVAPGSLAEERGLRAGDVIIEINRQGVRSLADARRIAANARSVMLLVQRGGRSTLIIMR